MSYRVNYVIASYPGIGRRSYKYPAPDETVRRHLEHLQGLSHQLTQVTLMRAACTGEQYANYYQNLPQMDNLVILDCPNHGYSNGQWMQAYEKYRDEFDFYFLVEDDYVFSQPDFDQIMIRLYQKKFPENLGLLCGYHDGWYNDLKPFPQHYEGPVLIHEKSFRYMYQNPFWEGDPYRWLNQVNVSKKISHHRWLDKKGRLISKDRGGGSYQVAFSQLFTHSGIPHDDYLDEWATPDQRYGFFYWDDLKEGLSWVKHGKAVIYRDFSADELRERLKYSLGIPIQISNEQYLQWYARD